MMSLSEINRMSDEAASEAARDGKVPYVPFGEDEIENYPPFPFPNLGKYTPRGWKLVDTLFCDSSGFGGDNEPALSPKQLVAKLVAFDRNGKEYGYGIVEAGQFQVRLGVFQRRIVKSKRK